MRAPSHLELQLLALLDDEPRHGYALRAELRRRSSGLFDPPAGTLYPLLRELESRGLAVSGWRPGPRRSRRVYRLTASGRRELDRRLREWAAYVGAVTAVLGGG